MRKGKKFGRTHLSYNDIEKLITIISPLVQRTCELLY